MPTPLESYTLYIAAWNEKDQAMRENLLEQCWAEDGRLITPRGVLEGRKAVNEQIYRVMSEVFPEHTISSTSEIEIHHNYIRATWEIKIQAGKISLDGIDFGEFDETSKLKSLTEFFGVLPPSKQKD